MYELNQGQWCKPKLYGIVNLQSFINIDSVEIGKSYSVYILSGQLKMSCETRCLLFNCCPEINLKGYYLSRFTTPLYSIPSWPRTVTLPTPFLNHTASTPLTPTLSTHNGVDKYVTAAFHKLQVQTSSYSFDLWKSVQLFQRYALQYPSSWNGWA